MLYSPTNPSSVPTAGASTASEAEVLTMPSISDLAGALSLMFQRSSGLGSAPHPGTCFCGLSDVCFCLAGLSPRGLAAGLDEATALASV